MATSFDVEVLYDKIYVYRAAFPEPDAFIEEVKKLDKWHPWYVMGEMLTFGTEENSSTSFYKAQTFPDKKTWDELVSLKTHSSEKISGEVQSIFFDVTSDYLEKNPTDLPNWTNHFACVCRYDTYGGAGNGFAMNYHTDYQVDREGEPGSKFAITCTMYLNDDYEGGSLLFRIHKEDGSIVELDYKPKAGDIVVFPSGEPYLHGVEEVRSGVKYFIRTFWCYDSEGSEEWKAGVEKHGSEEWEKILKQRRQEAKVYGAENKDD